MPALAVILLLAFTTLVRASTPLPDTQYYSSTLNGGLPAMFQAQTDWIVANRAASNIAMVTHMGDIVQNGDNGGNNVEWLVATNAMYRMENPLTTLLANGIPYGVAVGNHDQSPIGNADGSTPNRYRYTGEQWDDDLGAYSRWERELLRLSLDKSDASDLASDGISFSLSQRERAGVREKIRPRPKFHHASLRFAFHRAHTRLPFRWTDP